MILNVWRPSNRSIRYFTSLQASSAEYSLDTFKAFLVHCKPRPCFIDPQCMQGTFLAPFGGVLQYLLRNENSWSKPCSRKPWSWKKGRRGRRCHYFQQGTHHCRVIILWIFWAWILLDALVHYIEIVATWVGNRWQGTDTWNLRISIQIKCMAACSLSTQPFWHMDHSWIPK